MRKIQYLIRLGLLAACGAYAFGPATADARANGPELPETCANIEVRAETKSARRLFAIGSQIYRWSGSAWEFVAPTAELFADRNYNGRIGTHYAGPTWESNSGSKVIGRRIADCAPDPASIPWLLLDVVAHDGRGMFDKSEYIQRVNTEGGIKPTVPGSFPGQLVWVPYAAEYVFYSEKNK